jgi:Domain of unknown function (DUF1707)
MSELVPEPYDVLASDPEREAVAAVLREHAVDGRLDAEELEARLGVAYGARRRADLLPLLADLPAAPAPRARPSSEPPPFAPVIPIAILLVAIWAFTGADYFWPMWPIGAMLLMSIMSGAQGCARRGHDAAHSSAQRDSGSRAASRPRPWTESA